MKKQLFTLIIFSLCLFAFKYVEGSNGKASGWKAGVASIVITPDESMWMGGFGFRNRPSEGKTTELWAKALAIEDENGKRAVFVSIETAGVRKSLYDAIQSRLESKYNLSKSQVLINSSHTHTGAETMSSYVKDPKEKIKIDDYVAKLENQIVDLVGEALKSLQPVTLYAENGVTRFQVNRRNNIEYKLHLQSHFNGPNDYAVPVIKVAKESGDLLAIVFGYACHNSVLRDYKFSGDYAGFAQIELEKLYPGATAIFMQGAGGNQVGHPRGTIEAAKQHGRSLAAAVESVLSEKMRELTSNLSTSYSEINLEPGKLPPTKDELIKIIADSLTYPNYIRNRAELNLEKLNRGEPFITSYPYPVQVWKIGDQSIITLGGEPVVEYALELKHIFGENTFVFGYTSYVMAYISTPLILNEGGYEGLSSPFFGSPWATDIKSKIFQELLKLAKQVNVKLP